jgi:hypothetical protein
MVCLYQQPFPPGDDSYHVLHHLQKTGAGDDRLAGKMSPEYRVPRIQSEGSFGGLVFPGQVIDPKKIVQQHYFPGFGGGA